MENHISFEEISEYIFGENKAETFFEQEKRINSHIMKCSECYKMYEALVNLDEKIDDYKFFRMLESEKRVRLINALKKAYSNLSISKIIDMVYSLAELTAFKIESNMRTIIGTNGYYNPKFADVMKSTSTDDKIKERELKSTIVNSENIQICISLDGTLSIYASSADYKEGQKIALMPKDTEKEILIKEFKEYNCDTLYARFFDIDSNEYEVFMLE